MKKDREKKNKLRGTFDEAVIKKREAIHTEENRVRDIKAYRKIINKLLKLRQ